MDGSKSPPALPWPKALQFGTGFWSVHISFTATTGTRDWDWEHGHHWNEEDIDATGYYGYRGKANKKERERRLTRRATMLHARKHKSFRKILPAHRKVKGEKGKGKGGFQGACYNCGEYGHPAKECTKTGSKGKGKDQ
jgi:hypothetical protein